MPSQDIMLLTYPEISSHRDLVSASFKHFTLISTKVDVTIKNLIRNN